MEGRLDGEKEKYPYVTQKVVGLKHEKTIIKDEEHLIEIISEELANPINKDKQLSQILEENGISGVQLIDNRTSQLLQNFLFYENTPHVIDNSMWFWVVVNLKPLFRMRIL